MPGPLRQPEFAVRQSLAAAFTPYLLLTEPHADRPLGRAPDERHPRPLARLVGRERLGERGEGGDVVRADPGDDVAGPDARRVGRAGQGFTSTTATPAGA